MSAPAIDYASGLPSTADLAIVGGGIAGCALAFFAARAGLHAVVVERRPRLATLTTAAATGAFRLQFDNPEELALVRESVEFLETFDERSGLEGWSIGLRRQGYLFCALTEAGASRARLLVERQQAWGLTDVELLGGEEARHRFPYLGEVVAARYRGGDGFLDQIRLAAGYATAASASERIPDATPGGSAVFVTGTEVVGFLGGEQAITGIATARGQLSAGATIVAAGPFSGRVAKMAGLELDIRPTVRQKLVFPELTEIPPEAPMTIEDETGAHWRPALRGCFALWTDPNTASSEPIDPVPASPSFAFGLLDPASDHALARLVPFWRDVWERGSDHWLLEAGQYEYTPDRRPLIGPTGIPGLFADTGFSGHGVMSSAAAARLAIDLVAGRTDAQANPFRLDRPMIEASPDVL